MAANNKALEERIKALDAARQAETATASTASWPMTTISTAAPTATKNEEKIRNVRVSAIASYSEGRDHQADLAASQHSPRDGMAHECHT